MKSSWIDQNSTRSSVSSVDSVDGDSPVSEWYLGMSSLFLIILLYICNWEFEFIIFLSYHYFLRVDSSRKYLRYVQLFQILKMYNQNISIPNPFHRDQLILQKRYQIIFPCLIDEFFIDLSLKSIDVQQLHQRNYCTIKWLCKSSVIRSFSSVRRSHTFRRSY